MQKARRWSLVVAAIAVILVVAITYLVGSNQPLFTISANPSPTYRPTTSSPQPATGISRDEAMDLSPDSDGDGLVNIADNCPFVANPDQADNDGDAIGDDCYSIELAKRDLASRLKVNAIVAGIGPVKVEATVWPDTCLGVPSSSEECLPVETPGYKVYFEVTRVPGQLYLYHVDRDANFLFLGPVDSP